MTKKQQHLIGLLTAILIYLIAIFRPDLFLISGRPRISNFLYNYFSNYIITISILLFAFFLAKFFLIKWWVFICVFSCIEVCYLFSFHFGPKIFFESIRNTSLLNHLKEVSLHNRPMIQFEENCSKFDSVLFYTLKPGNSFFNYHEFKTKLYANSAGLRDEEKALKKPKVLFLGDSHTFGWGVNQDETFSTLFKEETKTVTLNAGMPSYGTAREFLSFKRIERDSLELIVIQFNETDPPENQYFISNKSLGKKNEVDFIGATKANTKLKNYYFFQYLKTAVINFFVNKILPLYKRNMKQNISFIKEYPSYVPDFFYFIKEIEKDYKGKILITYVGGFKTDKNIVESFETFSKKAKLKNLYFLNLGNILTENDYFFLDDHLNPQGHKKASDEIIKFYKKYFSDAEKQ